MVEPQTAHLTSARVELPDFHSRAALAELLGLPTQKLNWWLQGFPIDKRYRHFAVAKRGKGQRQIAAPIAPIKEMQRRLATALTAAYRAPAHVHGFTLGRSPQTNAAVHVNQRWVFGIDLEDFFPTITERRVRGMFEAFPFEYSKEIATLLARLCCHRDCLPQGAPSSPIISNYICRGMDRQLAELAIRHRCFYSRYADDLIFSTDRPVFPTALVTNEGGKAVPSIQLARIVENAGFVINKRKTRIQICFQRQRVTGLIVNEKVNVSRHYIRSIRAVLHIWEKQGPEAAAQSIRKADKLENFPPQKPYPSLGQVMRGRVQHVGAVRGFNDPVYLKLARKLSERDPHFNPPTTILASAIEARLYTEGPTDPRHIRAALEHFHGKGEFLNLKLIADENTDQGSDQKLLEKAKYLREFPPETYSVCLFDTDTKVARDAVGEDGWQEYGSRTVAVGLARPEFREQHKPLCIELLHEDPVLEATDADGRRVFKASEFNPTTSIHKSGNYVIPNLPGKSLIAEPVYELGSNDSVARPKAAFARAVEEDPESFGDLSFLGFRPTLERITTALASLQRSA